jgi:hypothetical protein
LALLMPLLPSIQQSDTPTGSSFDVTDPQSVSEAQYWIILQRLS